MSTLRGIVGVGLLAAAVVVDALNFQYPMCSPWDYVTTDTAWTILKENAQGRLYEGVPMAKSCFDAPASQACSHARARYGDETSRSNVFGGYINTQWETCQSTGEQCLLDYTNLNSTSPTSPPYRCSLGSIPNYYLDIRSPQEITAAFQFSKKTGVPLVVKNTGHDYMGRSSAPGALAIWTHSMKNMSYHPSFVPSGCPPSKSSPGMTVGAGTQWGEAYAFAEAHNITIVGGSDKNVGVAGGWLQGGGHGMLSNVMGLGVDRVLEFKVVTPDGILRTANTCQHQDLFFALRGGGGGTFGVVTEATILASPQVTLQAVILTFRKPTPGVPSNLTRDLFTVIVSNTVRWADEGWGGIANAHTAIYVNPLLTPEQGAVSMKPLIDFGHKMQEGMKSTSDSGSARVVVTEFKSWGTFFNVFANSFVASVGHSLALASRLIPSDNFVPSKQTELVQALAAANDETNSLILLIAPPWKFSRDGSAKDIKANDAKTSVTPAWRSSLFHTTVVSPWNYNATLEEKKAQYARSSRAMNHLRTITPDAAYVNEADVHEESHERVFWGKNYEELLRIKRK
ncbi:hypothetical protein ONZ45_g8527 [Pleurotus djamor]|nr:hypothetical protein ONZ45_g8527 [Pleurotus djamor]